MSPVMTNRPGPARFGKGVLDVETDGDTDADGEPGVQHASIATVAQLASFPVALISVKRNLDQNRHGDLPSALSLGA